MYKIGQMITIKEDIPIQTLVNGTELKVEKGDLGIIDSGGNLHIVSGNAKGKIVFTKYEVKGYDIDQITRLITIHLNKQFELGDILDDHGIDLQDVQDEIYDVLDDIL